MCYFADWILTFKNSEIILFFFCHVKTTIFIQNKCHTHCTVFKSDSFNFLLPHHLYTPHLSLHTQKNRFQLIVTPVDKISFWLCHQFVLETTSGSSWMRSQFTVTAGVKLLDLDQQRHNTERGGKNTHLNTEKPTSTPTYTHARTHAHTHTHIRTATRRWWEQPYTKTRGTKRRQSNITVQRSKKYLKIYSYYYLQLKYILWL